jgi:hypothetical protein
MATTSTPEGVEPARATARRRLDPDLVQKTSKRLKRLYQIIDKSTTNRLKPKYWMEFKTLEAIVLGIEPPTPTQPTVTTRSQTKRLTLKKAHKVSHHRHKHTYDTSRAPKPHQRRTSHLCNSDNTVKHPPSTYSRATRATTRRLLRTTPHKNPKFEPKTNNASLNKVDKPSK